MKKKTRYQDTYASFRSLRNTELQTARDLYYIHRQLTEEFAVLRGANYFTCFFDLFTVRSLGFAAPCLRLSLS
jgi:hypothetical protein